MNRVISACAACALLLIPALAYGQAAPPPYVDTTCGSWQDDAWVPNGTCSPDDTHRYHGRVAGTITAVKGHLVTVQQADRTVTIDDSPALSNQLTGKVAVGRQIVAHGYWRDGNFYATLLTTNDVATAPHR